MEKPSYAIRYPEWLKDKINTLKKTRRKQIYKLGEEFYRKQLEKNIEKNDVYRNVFQDVNLVVVQYQQEEGFKPARPPRRKVKPSKGVCTCSN